MHYAKSKHVKSWQATYVYAQHAEETLKTHLDRFISESGNYIFYKTLVASTWPPSGRKNGFLFFRLNFCGQKPRKVSLHAPMPKISNKDHSKSFTSFYRDIKI